MFESLRARQFKIKKARLARTFPFACNIRAIVKVDPWVISWGISKSHIFASIYIGIIIASFQRLLFVLMTAHVGGVMNPVTVCNKRPIESVTGFGDCNGAFVKD